MTCAVRRSESKPLPRRVLVSRVGGDDAPAVVKHEIEVIAQGGKHDVHAVRDEAKPEVTVQIERALHDVVMARQHARAAVAEAGEHRQRRIDRGHQLLEGSHSVPSALTGYDLPELAACLAPRPLLIVSPVDAADQPAGPELVAGELEMVHRTYANEAMAFELLQSVASANLPNTLVRWLFS